MAIQVKVNATIFDTAKRRVVKFLRLGKNDVRTATQIGPFGVDSNPIKNMIAIWSDTAKTGSPVIVGYMNVDQLAETGETRLYSTDANGALQMFVWLKNDGKLQLGGDDHNAVRFSPLKSGLDSQVNLINAELVKIQTAIAGLGGAYARANVSVNIDSAKIDEILTL